MRVTRAAFALLPFFHIACASPGIPSPSIPSQAVSPTAPGRIEYGQIVDGDIRSPKQTDEYSFMGEKGQVVQVFGQHLGPAAKVGSIRISLLSEASEQSLAATSVGGYV